MKAGDVVKHRNFLDVCCYVANDSDTNQVAIYWMNQGFVESWLLNGGSQLITLDSNWLICDDPAAECLRYTKWSKL
jgi:hypothetical protein